MSRRATDFSIFDSLCLEGGFFVPAILEKIAFGEHTAQKALDYKLPKGLTLMDEQGRAFRIASALWKNFDTAHACRDIAPAAATHNFAVELLRDALGYTDLAPCAAPVALGDRTYPIAAYTKTDLDYVVPRVLELTYTSHDMKPWAEDLGHSGSPYAFNPARRAQLRAELDAYYAKLYNLTRDELRYTLDPADTHGDDYPTETFRGLKANDLKHHGEYRTRRLVMEAWDGLAKEDVPIDKEIALPAMPTTPRAKLTSDESHWLVFIYHFLLRAGDRATLPLIEDAWVTLIQRKQNSLVISDVIGDAQCRLWDASFNQEYPNQGFIEFLIRLNQNSWINVTRGTWKITIPESSPLLTNPPDTWRNYDAAFMLRIAIQRLNIASNDAELIQMGKIIKYKFIGMFERAFAA